MEEKKERKRAVAKKIITPNMHEWLPVSPKMPEKAPEPEEKELDLQEVFVDKEQATGFGEADIKSLDSGLSGAGKSEYGETDDLELDVEDSEIEESDEVESDIEDLEIEEADDIESDIEDLEIEEADDIESDVEDLEIEEFDEVESDIEDLEIDETDETESDTEDLQVEESDDIESNIEGLEIEEDSDIEESEIEPVGYEPVQEEPHSRVALSDNKSGLGMGWYVVHTYSGYENKVKANIEKAIENRHLENEILEVRVPLQEVMELKNGVEKTSQKKLFPGYVLLHMDADNNDAWYVVRNTRGVTGFVGPGSKPVPLTEEELKALDFGSEVTDVAFSEGDVINVIAGVWKDTVGTVQKIDVTRQTVTINVEMFGRETPVEINFSDVKKMWD